VRKSATWPLSNWLAGALLFGILPLFFIDLKRWFGEVPAELHAFAHVGVFALFAVVLMSLSRWSHWPARSRAVVVLLIILLSGALIELVQPLFGRSGSLRDVGQNLVGAAAGLSLYARAGMWRRLTMSLVGILLVLALGGPALNLLDRALARTQFPILGDFESRLEHRRWSAGVPDGTIVRMGTRSLRVELEPGRYAGTMLQRSFGDWRGFAHLELSLYNPDVEPLPVTVSIRDQEHFRRGGEPQDRFDRRFTIEPGWNDLRIAIPEIRDAPAQRSLDLDDLSQMVIFTSELEYARLLYLDRVRLTGQER